MKRLIVLLVILIGLINPVSSQDAATRKEFNRLLAGIWGDKAIRKFDNLTIELIKPSEEQIRSGWTVGEMSGKDFKYIGNNKFELKRLFKGKNNGIITEEWIKARITVYDTYYLEEYLEKTTKFGTYNSVQQSQKFPLIEKLTVYPPELIIELKSSTDIIHSKTKTYLYYTIKNIGMGRAHSVKISLTTVENIEGLRYKPAFPIDGFKAIINSNSIAKGEFEIEANDMVGDANVLFTVKVDTDDDYTTSQTITLRTKGKFERGLPPDLFAELSFKDENNNGILEAQENSTLFIKITNKGKGNAQELKVSIEDNLIDNDLIIGGYTLDLLEPGKSVDISVPIRAGLNIKTAEHRLKIKVAEHFGYDMDDAFLVLNTFAYQPPNLVFSGMEISDSGENTYAIKEDGLLQAGEQITVQVTVQNIGQGDANNVMYFVTSQNKDIYVDQSSNTLEHIKPGQTKEFTFTLSPNKRFASSDKLPVYLTLKESIGRGNLVDFHLPITLNARPPKTEILKVNSDFESLKKNIAKFEYNSNKFTLNTSSITDISTIALSKMKRKNSVAVIFGIEKYKELPPAPYASNDADLIKDYFQKRLGIEKVVVYKDLEASGFIFDDVFNPDNGELQKAIVKGQTDLFVYYSGHGIPNKSGDNIYLFPSDGKIARLETQGYELNKLYENLDKLGAKSVTVFLDACFSGGSRTSDLKKTENLTAMKGIRIKPKIEGDWMKNENFTVFSSSSVEETSLGFDPAETGLFTYYLCAGLQGKADLDNDRKITVGEMKKYIYDNVTETSKKISGLQTPVFFGNVNTVLVEY